MGWRENPYNWNSEVNGLIERKSMENTREKNQEERGKKKTRWKNWVNWLAWDLPVNERKDVQIGQKDWTSRKWRNTGNKLPNDSTLLRRILVVFFCFVIVKVRKLWRSYSFFFLTVFLPVNLWDFPSFLCFSSLSLSLCLNSPSTF